MTSNRKRPPLLTPLVFTITALAEQLKRPCRVCLKRTNPRKLADGKCRYCTKRSAVLDDFYFLLATGEIPEVAAKRIGRNLETIYRYRTELRDLRYQRQSGTLTRCAARTALSKAA